MLIEEYFLSLERVLASCPQIQRVTLTKEKRAPDLGLVKGAIVFSGGLQLFIMEFVRTEPRVVKTKYRYHCQDASGTPIFAMTMLRIILQRLFPTINMSSMLLLKRQSSLLIPPL